MRILVSGSTGFLGTALVETLEGQGHSIARLVRPETSQKSAAGVRAESVSWDPVAGQFDAAGAEGTDALIHLAGASIAGGRWSVSRKKLLRTSRIDATRHLIGALAKLQRPPRVMVAASAIGYYGNRGDETLTEASAPGNDFLAGLCQEWEAETSRGAGFGARVVNLRFGIILAAHGGRAAADGDAVQIWRGRAAWRWPPMDVLADSAGNHQHHPIRPRDSRAHRTCQRRRAKSRSKQRIHKRPGENTAPAGVVSRACVRTSAGAGGNGGRIASHQPKGDAVQACGFGVSVLAAQPRGRSRGRVPKIKSPGADLFERNSSKSSGNQANLSESD